MAGGPPVRSVDLVIAAHGHRALARRTKIEVRLQQP